jgi:hypothetical protein
MIRQFAVHTALITCDSATDDCEASIGAAGDTVGSAGVQAWRAAETAGWVSVRQLGGRLLITRCPDHANEVANLEPVPAP